MTILIKSNKQRSLYKCSFITALFRGRPVLSAQLAKGSAHAPWHLRLPAPATTLRDYEFSDKFSLWSVFNVDTVPTFKMDNIGTVPT